MEVARGGNDHVYTRFKLLSYATQPAMMPFDDDYGWCSHCELSLSGIQTYLKRVKFSRKYIKENFRALP